MKTTKIFLIVYLLTQIVWAQGNSSTENKSYLPNITPPSPEAFAISEYGKNGISEFSGKLNLSIPLYTFSAGQLSLPISLNYSGAGVKVNDISTWAGMNWNLSAGGVITRRVNDFADEEISIIRKYINEQHLITNASNTCAQFSQDYYNMCLFSDRYDTEVDVFNFNFNGYSGSFFLDENFIPAYIENENNIKIEIIGVQTTNLERLRVSKTFLITTPDGVKYYFGGQETEQTMTFSGHRGSSFLSNTGFYLFKIEHPVNGIIEFEYITAPGRLSFINKSYNMRYMSSARNTQAPPEYTQQFFKTQINNPKILSKIKSTNNLMTVNFMATIHASHNFISTLNRIEIKNNTNLLKEIDFTHGAKANNNQQDNNYETASRFFLEKIEFNKNTESNANKKEVYLFDYNNPYSLPNRLSNSQDILGYYNGAVNETLIPYNSLISINQNVAFANRHPNFELASQGALKKITYPTKGYSLFEYEPTDAKEKVFRTYFGSVEGSSIFTTPGENAAGESVIFTPIYQTQEVVINIRTGVTETSESGFDLAVYQTHHAKRVELKITDVTANSTPVYIRRALGMNPKFSSHTFTFIKDHVYSLELKILSPDGTTTFNNLNADFDFKVMNGYQMIEGFGVRLKRQSDFGVDQNPTNSKRYYYRTIKPAANYVLSLPEINYMPGISYAYNSQLVAPNNPTSSEMFDYCVDIHSEAENKYCNAANNEFYDVVSTSYGGDNFENGGTEKFFLYNVNIGQQKVEVTNDGCWQIMMDSLGEIDYDGIHCGTPSTANTAITAVRNLYKSNEPTDMGMYNGKLLGERKYRNINNNLFKISETYNEYDTFAIPVKQAVNFVGKELFGIPVPLNYCSSDLSGTPRSALSSCYLGYYLVNCFDIKLTVTKKVQYIDPIPMSLYSPLTESELAFSIYYNPEIDTLEAPYKKITTTETYQYGTLKGLPTTITTSTSESGVDKKTVNTYVNTAATLPNIPTTQSALYTSLINQNRVATPVQVQQFENTTLLSTQRTLFKKWNNNNNHILPELIQTSKGATALEDRAVFTEYDTKGNPTVFSLKDGTKTKYFYNTNNQVIMKVENFLTTQNIPANPTWTNACTFIAAYPTASITIFNYDSITNQIVSVVSPNCDTQYYIYDAMHRLKFIKDNAGNIVKEFDQNYKN